MGISVLTYGLTKEAEYRDVGQLAQSYYTANQWGYGFQTPLVTEKPLAREVRLSSKFCLFSESLPHHSATRGEKNIP